MAVVDRELRVHGIRGLRVADASIMPTMVSSNTNAPSFLIGERCADFLLREAGANITPDALQADAVARRLRADRRHEPRYKLQEMAGGQGPSPTSVIMMGCGRFSRYYHVPVLEADAGVAFAGIFDPTPSEEVRELLRRTGAALVGAIEDLPKPSQAESTRAMRATSCR